VRSWKRYCRAVCWNAGKYRSNIVMGVAPKEQLADAPGFALARDSRDGCRYAIYL
jgi:hypothetical protein